MDSNIRQTVRYLIGTNDFSSITYEELKTLKKLITKRVDLDAPKYTVYRLGQASTKQGYIPVWELMDVQSYKCSQPIPNYGTLITLSPKGRVQDLPVRSEWYEPQYDSWLNPYVRDPRKWPEPEPHRAYFALRNAINARDQGITPTLLRAFIEHHSKGEDEGDSLFLTSISKKPYYRVVPRDDKILRSLQYIRGPNA